MHREPEEAFREIYRQAKRIFTKLAGQVIRIEEKKPNELLSTASLLLSNSFNRIVSRYICFFLSLQTSFSATLHCIFIGGIS